jgi:hypothetical protein
VRLEDGDVEAALALGGAEARDSAAALTDIGADEPLVVAALAASCSVPAAGSLYFSKSRLLASAGVGPSSALVRRSVGRAIDEAIQRTSRHLPGLAHVDSTQHRTRWPIRANSARTRHVDSTQHRTRLADWAIPQGRELLRSIVVVETACRPFERRVRHRAPT